MSRLLSAGILASLACCLLTTVRAQTKAFSETFSAGSTINSNPISPATPAVGATAYQQLAGKSFNPNPPAITPGNLRFGIVSTSSGFNHIQALFTKYPVTLVNTGDFIELTVNFTTEGGIITPQTNSTLFFGLHNAGQVQPMPGGTNGNVAIATAGFAQGWQGYVNRIFYTGGTNGFYTRPAQTAAAANNQDVLYNYASGSQVGSTAASTLAALTSGAAYTEVFRITKASATTLTLTSSLYAGTTPTGIPLYTQTSTSSSTLTNVFDAFAIGWRATGSVASVMNISAIKILTTGTTTIVPEILTQPFSVTKMVGESVTFSVVADGGAGTTLSYQWRKDGGDIPGATAANFEIPAVSLADAGDYTVVVTDVAGSTTSNAATLTVTTGAVPPSIVTQPTGATLLVGGSHTFTATANGTAPLAFQWQLSTDGGVNYGDIPGANSTSHTVASATLADAGLYRLRVTNGQGAANSDPAALVVSQGPAITAQPVGGALALGGTITLSVSATGTPAPTYQWRKNGANIPGATSDSYTITGATGAQAGNYTVVVTNSVSSVTSATAAVTVLSPTLAVSSVTPANNAGSLLPDTRLTITFNEAVTPGVSGYLRIHDAATDAVVDTIDLVAATAARDTLRVQSTLSTQLLPVQKKPIGGIPNDFNYYPITVSGNTATIHPRNNVLAYGKTYYVKIEPGVFLNANGETFAGISDNTAWRFSTKASGPTAGATVLTVAADGSGDFHTLQAALDFLPANNSVPVTIRLKSGTYFEMVGFQAKHFVTIIGDNADQTVLEYPNNNTFNNVSGVYHRSTLVAQSVHDFTLANLTIRNTTPQNGSQAEAIVINGTGATTAHNLVTGCKFYGYQDTVQFNKQTYVSDCVIWGDVDFMWGDGPAFFENCDIRILRTGGYFTQIRNGNGNHGYVFRNCRFTAPAGISGTFFGRIDPAGFPYSEVVVLDSTIGDATNNAFLATATGISGANYLGGWWLLNNVNSPASATNVHNWDDANIDGAGAPLANPNADVFTTMPSDPTTLANYRNATWVLNTNLAGTILGSWTPSLAPIISTHPTSQTVAVGQSVNFSVTAIAIPNATYQWQKDLVDIPGATSATYSIPSVGGGDVGQYRVIVTNSAGSSTSNAASLNVSGMVIAPEITSHPAPLTITAGESATFSVTATGTTLAYQWQKNGTDIPGATSATYNIASATVGDTASYRAVVSNAAGTAISNSAVLVVNAGSAAALVQDTFADGNSQNEDLANNSLRLFNGRSANTRTDAVGSVSFLLASSSSEGFWAHFSPTGSPVALGVGDRLTVEVTFSVTGFVGTGQDVRFGVFNSNGTRNTTNLTGGHNSSLFADDLAYGVRYTASGSTTPFSMLKRNPVGQTANPNNPFNSTNPTDWATLTTNAVGTTALASLANATNYTLTYEIFRETETNTVVSSFVTGGALPEAYGATATDTATTLTSFDYFVFRIGGSGFAGGISFSRFEVAVERSAPKITAQPTFGNGQSTQTLGVSDSATLSVTASGAALLYQWYKDGAPVPGATSATLALTNVQTTDSGDYTVIISNGGGALISNAATLLVTGGPVAPTITTQPLPQTVGEGMSASFTVAAKGTTPFTYQWYKGGSAIPGATGATYTIASTTLNDTGDYSVVVTNSVGFATSNLAALVVKGIAKIAPSGYAAGVTGGAAGPTVIVNNASDLRTYADASTPYTIVVSGVIDLGVNGRMKLQSNKTLRGATTASTLLGTITISNANNVIVSNLNISANTGAPATNDGITISTSTNVLVTKCTIFDCTDGNLDINNGSDLVTISWCKFYYTRNNGHNFSNLVGSADDDTGPGDGKTNYRVTWHHNWWSIGAKQRMIACRFGNAHMFNNYWSCTGNDYCTESRNLAEMFSEFNYYDAVNNPLAKRVVLPTDLGLLMTLGNVFNNCTGNQAVTTDTVFTPPYAYELDATAAIPAIVMAGAGNVPEDAPLWSSASITSSASPATVGDLVTLTAVPSGFAPTSYQWRFKNVPIAGATAATLVLNNVQPADAGAYTVALGTSDGAAVVSAPLVLKVQVPPSITTQPVSQTVTVGDNVSFVVTATGDATLTYQWRKDGNAIAGAVSPTLTLTSVVTAAAGDYDCVVTNAAGSAISNVAKLTVNKAVATVLVENATFTYDGAPKSLTVTTAPAGLPVVLTYNGALNAPSDAGTYTVNALVEHVDYVGSGSGSLVINQALAGVTLGNLTQTFDGTPRSATATTDPIGLPVVLSYDGSNAAPTNAGSYAVVGTVNHPNYTGTASGTLNVAKAAATVTLGSLLQNYDGTGKTVTFTTTPTGLQANLLYDGGSTAPIYPGPHAVVATIEDPNYSGAANDTLLITITALVRHAPALNSDIDGSLQVLLPESVTLNGEAMISGDLLMPGTPSLLLNGNPTFGGTRDGLGSSAPTNHTATLNGGAVLRYLVRRVDAIAMPEVAAPPLPTGTRDVVLARASDTIGDFATLRNLTMNTGKVTVPPGTYGTFNIGGKSVLTFGVANATEPAIYNFENLSLKGTSSIQVVGPVILTVGQAIVFNSTSGNPAKPEWLLLNVASGGVTLNTGAALHGYVIAPNGTVILGENAKLRGQVISDGLTLNKNALLDDSSPQN